MGNHFEGSWCHDFLWWINTGSGEIEARTIMLSPQSFHIPKGDSNGNQGYYEWEWCYDTGWAVGSLLGDNCGRIVPQPLWRRQNRS